MKETGGGQRTEEDREQRKTEKDRGRIFIKTSCRIFEDLNWTPEGSGLVKDLNWTPEGPPQTAFIIQNL